METANLLTFLPIETTCQMTSFLDYKSLIKFLQACKLLWSMRNSNLLTVAIDHFNGLKLKNRSLHITNVQCANERLICNAEMSQYEELRKGMDILTIPHFAVKDSVTYKGLLKMGAYTTVNSIRNYMEVLSDLVSSDDSVIHLMDSLYPMGNYDTMVIRCGKLAPCSLADVKEPMNELRSLLGHIGNVLGSHLALKSLTYSEIKRLQRGGPPLFLGEPTGSNCYLRTIYVPVELVLLSKVPFTDEVEECVSRVANKVRERCNI